MITIAVLPSGDIKAVELATGAVAQLDRLAVRADDLGDKNWYLTRVSHGFHGFHYLL